MMSVVFFFKQKTAYEMRISDWSSDVCSSDLNKGINSYNNQSFDNALKYFKVATDLNPTDTTLYLNTGVTAEKVGDTALAIASYGKLVELKYKDPAIYAVLANLYFTKGDDDNALEIGRAHV